MKRETSGRTGAAVLVMLATPLFFSTNLIFGRHVVGEVAPFTLALIRWGAVAIALAPFALRERAEARRLLAERAGTLFLLGFLGMWVCGALVYVALAMTTATNATLIYTTSPVFILLIAAVRGGRPIGKREAAGSAIAFAGVGLIVLRGRPAALLELGLDGGDLLILAAAIAWAVYSLTMRAPRLAAVSNLALLSLVAGCGAVLLLPFALFEFASGQPMPLTASAWQAVAGIVVFASLLAFLGFQVGIRILGAPAAGVFMYLLPAYGVGLAVLFLGEEFRPFHAAGIVLVIGGVVLATLPPGVLEAARRLLRR